MTLNSMETEAAVERNCADSAKTGNETENAEKIPTADLKNLDAKVPVIDDETPLNISDQSFDSDNAIAPKSPIVAAKDSVQEKLETVVEKVEVEKPTGDTSNAKIAENDNETVKNAAELKPDLSDLSDIPESIKSFKPGDQIVTLVNKPPDTSTTLKFNYTNKGVKDLLTYRKIFIKGLQMGDLFHPTLYTLIQLASQMEFDCKMSSRHPNSSRPSLETLSDKVKNGRLVLFFNDVLDRFTYLRRYLLTFEIPGRHVELNCTIPDDQTFDVVEMWKMSSKEEAPPCLSTVPERQILARQLVLKNINDSVTEEDILSLYKMLEKVEFNNDYQKNRCAILTFTDIFYCQIAHARQYEVKLDGKSPEAFLMTEMASKSQFLPLKLKEETEEEIQTRNTFNALWNSMLATVEEIRSKNKQNNNKSFGQGSSYHNSPLHRDSKAKQNQVNKDHHQQKKEQPETNNDTAEKPQQSTPENKSPQKVQVFSQKNQQNFGNKQYLNQQQQQNAAAGKRRNDSDMNYSGPQQKMSRKSMKRLKRQNAAAGRFSGGFTPYGGSNGSSSSFGPWLNNGGFAHGGGSVVANSTSYPNAASYASDFGERGVGGMPIGYAGEGGVPVYASGYGAANYASGFGGNSQVNQDMSPQRNQTYGRPVPGSGANLAYPRYFDFK